MFERGFKAWCERYSIEKRKELGVKSSKRLDPYLLANSLGIKVWTPEDIPGLSREHIDTLLQNDGKTPSCWSAVTLVVGSKTLVILNSSHSIGRQASDLMHELSHRILSHEPHQTEASPDGIMLLSAYEKQEEDEADWLSATLLLPRKALEFIKHSRLQDDVAAREYGVSIKMLKYRMSMTGVNKQYSISKSS